MDYGSNTMIERFPDGQDIEIFKFSSLEKAWKNGKLASEKRACFAIYFIIILMEKEVIYLKL